MASLPAIRYVASTTKSALGHLYLQCHVKPRASKQREGIISVSDAVIDVCVSAQAREGEANKAVREVFSDVNQIWAHLVSISSLIPVQVLNRPKSDIEVIRGMKSRDKTISIARVDVKGNEEDYISKVRAQLQTAIN
jgi:uncharacterized protein